MYVCMCIHTHTHTHTFTHTQTHTVGRPTTAPKKAWPGVGARTARFPAPPPPCARLERLPQQQQQKNSKVSTLVTLRHKVSVVSAETLRTFAMACATCVSRVRRIRCSNAHADAQWRARLPALTLVVVVPRAATDHGRHRCAEQQGPGAVPPAARARAAAARATARAREHAAVDQLLGRAPERHCGRRQRAGRPRRCQDRDALRRCDALRPRDRGRRSTGAACRDGQEQVRGWRRDQGQERPAAPRARCRPPRACRIRQLGQRAGQLSALLERSVRRHRHAAALPGPRADARGVQAACRTRRPWHGELARGFAALQEAQLHSFKSCDRYCKTPSWWI